MAEGGLTPYIGWFAFIALAIVYAAYKGFDHIHSRHINKKVNPQLTKKLITDDTENNQQKESKSNDMNERLETFKPSMISSFMDVQDIINSCIFTAYFYKNTGYKLNSFVGSIQILLFSMEIIFQIIDIFICIIWNFKLNIPKISLDTKLIVNYYKFKIIQCNFGFLKTLFKLYYSFDNLHENITFYNIVFGLTMVFKSYWMLIIDFMAKREKTENIEKENGLKSRLLNKAENGLLQLFIMIPLFYFVNSIILGLEIMNNKLIMLIYCILWFIGPWIYFLSTKINKKYKCPKCDEIMKWLCGISQCFINTILFLIGIIGGFIVIIPKFQFYSTIIIYAISVIVLCLTCCYYRKSENKSYESYKKIITCCCLIYSLPFIISLSFYVVDDIINDDYDGNYDNEYDNNNNEEDYHPVEVVP